MEEKTEQKQEEKQKENKGEEQSSPYFDTPKETRDKPFSNDMPKSDKPEFSRPTQCTVLSAKFQSDGKIVTTKKTREGTVVELAKEDQYKKHWLLVEFEYFDKETKEKKTFAQSYSGVREYDNRLWPGRSNNLLALKKTFEAYAGAELPSIWEIAEELVGRKCLVKSEPYEFGDNKGFSNKIFDFVDEEKK